MTLVVPFDGSELAEAALVRAVEFDAVFEEGVVAVSVVPRADVTHAREVGLLDADESFDVETVVERLHKRVDALAPRAEFQYEVVGKHASAGTIAKHVRRAARKADASLVVLGSENAGHLTVSVTSVGGSIASDDAYDVLIVRNRSPSKVDRVKESSPHTTFYEGERNRPR
ncbi:universal stress protein [Halolamina litorea]|uniref:Universal stress protein n=1 Tax=Halolamina litorea TaxID=1515593 RepID=A0ABD6BSH8_9EURY|nr:universal stress protein [Halolamina litorea]